MGRGGTNTFASLVVDLRSIMKLVNLPLRDFARAKTQSAVVAFTEHGEKQQSKEGLGDEVQNSVPEHL